MRKEKRNVIFIANRAWKHDRFFIGNIQETDDKGVVSGNDNCWISMCMLEFHCSCAKLGGERSVLIFPLTFSYEIFSLRTSPYMSARFTHDSLSLYTASHYSTSHNCYLFWSDVFIPSPQSYLHMLGYLHSYFFSLNKVV